jgi:hypothetical protein
VSGSFSLYVFARWAVPYSFSMFMLYIFGGDIERRGTKEFIKYYFITGIEQE